MLLGEAIANMKKALCNPAGAQSTYEHSGKAEPVSRKEVVRSSLAPRPVCEPSAARGKVLCVRVVPAPSCSPEPCRDAPRVARQSMGSLQNPGGRASLHSDAGFSGWGHASPALGEVWDCRNGWVVADPGLQGSP